MLIAGAAIAFGADLFIGAAVYFAGLLKVPPVLVGASVVALGTSLPEMSVTVSAARKGFGNIALGNVLGSCITNIGLIIGASGLVLPLKTTPGAAAPAAGLPAPGQRAAPGLYKERLAHSQVGGSHPAHAIRRLRGAALFRNKVKESVSVSDSVRKKISCKKYEKLIFF